MNKTNIAKNIIIVIFALLAAVSLIQGIRNGAVDSQDFQWDAAKAFALRINPYDVSLEQNGLMPGYEFDRYYLQMEANQFPSLLMILLPFTFLPPLAARYTWLVCNLLFTVLIIYLLRKTFLKDIDKQVYIMLALVMIAGTPYRNQLGVGQHTLFSFAMFLVAVYFSEYADISDAGNAEKTAVAGEICIEKQQRSLRNSIITTIALFLCYFKYTLTAPLALYFVYKKRYKELIISIAAHGMLIVFAAWWLNDSFLNMIIKPLKVASALLSEGGLDISALLHGSKIAYVLLLVIMLGLLILSIKMPEGRDNTLISVLTLWSLIITYHRTYDFFVIVIAAGSFAELANLKNNRICSLPALKITYAIVLFLVFFFLRLFSENTMSRYITGGVYYAFTIVMTYLATLNLNKE